MGDDPGEEPDAKGLGRVEGACRQEQVTCHRDADVSRERGGIGRVGDPAEQLGDSEGGPVACHRDVGHHGDQQPPGLADPVDRGDDRCRTVPHGQEREDIGPSRLGHFLLSFGTTAEVAAGGKDVTGPGDHQRGQLRIGVDQADRALDAVVHGGRERVARAGTVDHAPRDRVPHARVGGRVCPGRPSPLCHLEQGIGHLLRLGDHQVVARVDLPEASPTVAPRPSARGRAWPTVEVQTMW